MLVERGRMSIAYVNLRRAFGALLLLSLSLGGCANSPAGSSLMDARAEVTDHPKTTGYLPVEDVPPRPDKPAMTADEQLKLRKELIAARESQAKAKAQEDAAVANPAKP
jgi:hypothetical protein